MAWVDTPVITGAVPSVDPSSSVIGGVCIGGAAGDFPRENGPTANMAPPIIAARHTSPNQTTSRLLTFLMRTSGCRKSET
jgi:hypothetical protein